MDETGAALPVTEYCLRALEALKVEWGPTHTEIMVGEEPRMVEVNARWHAQDFCPIARACLGTDALVATIDAFLDPGTHLLTHRCSSLILYDVCRQIRRAAEPSSASG